VQQSLSQQQTRANSNESKQEEQQVSQEPTANRSKQQFSKKQTRANGKQEQTICWSVAAKAEANLALPLTAALMMLHVMCKQFAQTGSHSNRSTGVVRAI